MQINLAKSAGFCFGVKRAIDIALKTARSCEKVYMLGDIVHNEDVVREIKKAGIKKIKILGDGGNKTLLVRAHGAPLKTFEKARSHGYNIIDATCPMVKEIHRIVRAWGEKGFKIIVIGDKKHDEVQGIIGQLKQKAIIIDDIKNMPRACLKKIKKACVVVQSTQNLDKILKIVTLLKKYIPELKFFNTICRPTRTKQEEIKKMPADNDLMVIIGSKESANTRRLFEISRSINKKSYWVNSRRDIKKQWLKGAENIGVSAGASTPQETIRDIVKYLS